MAHELELRDGSASFVYVGNTAWHQLGQQIPAGTPLNTAIELARANYPVEAQPVFRKITVGTTDDYIEAKVAKVTVRTDTGRELGRVSPDYTPIQNVNAFQVLSPMIDAGVARVEAGGVLRDGQDAWMLLQVQPSAQLTDIGQALGVTPYLLVSNNHSGRAGLAFRATPVRVVCANTLAAAEMAGSDRATNAIVRHTGAAEARLTEQAQRIVANVLRDTGKMFDMFKALRSRFLDEAMFRTLVLDVVAPLPVSTPERPVQEFVRQRAETKRATLRQLWTGGIGHTGDMSAWEAYNGVVEYIDHNAEAYKGVPSMRLASLTDGSLAETRRTALNSLLTLTR